MKKLIDHIKKNKLLYIQVGISAAIMLLSPTVALASGLDDGGMKIYWKLIEVGKYIILGKGVVECIQSALNGDFDRAKSSAIGYLLCFGLMLALPAGLDQIEELFKK